MYINQEATDLTNARNEAVQICFVSPLIDKLYSLGVDLIYALRLVFRLRINVSVSIF